MQREWIEFKAETDSALLDTAAAVMSRIEPALVIEDHRDAGPDPLYGELVDESILSADKSRGSVAFYLPADSPEAPAAEVFLRERFAALGGGIVLTVTGRRSSEWEENWKKYYRPQRVGRIAILPAWLGEEPKDGEVAVRMDPGMAFGTGTHETTRLALSMIEDYLPANAAFLDVGCGSGILSIAASKLGARRCIACDLDPDAVRVARENAEKNGCENVLCVQSDLLSAVERIPGGYQLVAANLVAEIIVRLLPALPAFLAPGAVCLFSGIIDKSEGLVRDALEANGFRILRREQENDWVALAAARG